MSDVLSTAWQLWVVENLTAGVSPAQVVQALAGQGVPEDLARRHLREVVADPAFRRLRARAWRGRHAERAARLLEGLQGQLQLSTVDDCDAPTLREHYWARCRPVRLTVAFASLPALQRWTFPALRERFAGATVQVSADRDRDVPRSAKEASQRTIDWVELIDRAQGDASDAVYLVARSGLLHDPQFASLVDDLAPVPAFLDPAQTARHTGVWIGPAGTRTVAHFDPHGTMLLQVAGRKRLWLAPPTLGDLAEASDGWFTTHDLSDPSMADRVLEVELDAGQALLLPAGWWHEVTATAPSITLSFLGFAWDNDFHWIGPPSRA